MKRESEHITSEHATAQECSVHSGSRTNSTDITHATFVRVCGGSGCPPLRVFNMCNICVGWPVVGEVVNPSGRGRTATWEGMFGSATRVSEGSVLVQWHGSAVEDEVDCQKVVSTGTFQKSVPHHARVLDGSDEAELVTFYDIGHGSASPQGERSRRTSVRYRTDSTIQNTYAIACRNLPTSRRPPA